ncbi:MAG: AAA family ATPase [Cyclobacteriaceae bacterium]
MRFRKFIIKSYKAISGETTIDISKNSLFPIIGVNECGKTTILNAIFAFDTFNDHFDSTIRHLTDVENLYKIQNKQAEISAEIEVDYEYLREEILKIDIGKELGVKVEVDVATATQEKEKDLSFDLRKIRFPKKDEYKGFIVITRVIGNGKNAYKLVSPPLNFKRYPDGAENLLCTDIVANLPYILYFDDFRESFPEKIEVKESSKNDWASYVQQLFKKTNENYSIYKLKNIEDRAKKSIISHVTKKLNQTLTREWSNFKLDNKEALKISIDFIKEVEGENNEKYYLKFDVIESDPQGNERYFYVRDRSKGFYWFFNFVMKLQFNPKTNGSDNNAIYLLDEPGSYLHSYAQNKLCSKLKEISNSNIVIYCTHSHHLLNPDIIPLNKILIASKDDFGGINLSKYHDFKASEGSIQSSFQAVEDALMLRPVGLDLFGKKVLIVEGIYDYYSYKLFLDVKNYNFLPGKGAGTLSSFVSLMIGFDISYKVLWDNDVEGKSKYSETIAFFGDMESIGKFYTLPNPFRILQDIFAGEDIKLIKKELGLSDNVSFERVIASLYFSEKKEYIKSIVSDKTRDNFEKVREHLDI